MQTNFVIKTRYFELPWLTVTHWSAFGLHGCYPLGKYRDRDPRTIPNCGMYNWKSFLPCSCFSIRPTGTILRAVGMICMCQISLLEASKCRRQVGNFLTIHYSQNILRMILKIVFLVLFKMTFCKSFRMPLSRLM